MKSTIVFVLLTGLLVTASPLWAAQPEAVLQSLKGKVEVKVPGSKSWSPAVEGQILSPAAVLSTGFDSSVVVAIDKTTIQVKPLTRLTIDKLVEESGTVKTSTFLRVGSVSTSVKSAAGVKQDFKIQSPYSTASVRGTEFDFDGLKLKVREGLVAFILGRPQREFQPEAAPAEAPPAGEAAPGEVPPAGPAVPQEHPSDDFVGAPDITADPAKFVAVPAGQDAKLVVTFHGEPPKAVGSDDRSTLEKESGQKPSAALPSPTATQGGVTLTITFGP